MENPTIKNLFDEMLRNGPPRNDYLQAAVVQELVNSLAKSGQFIFPPSTPVRERLPERLTGTLFWAGDNHDGVWYAGFWNGGNWIDDVSAESVDGVTHWLPLPPNPE